MGWLLVLYLVLPDYFQSGESFLGLSWFAFWWENRVGWTIPIRYALSNLGWTVNGVSWIENAPYIQYWTMIVIPSLLLVLGTILPILLVAVMCFDYRRHSRHRALAFFVLSFALLIILLYNFSLYRYLFFIPYSSTNLFFIPTHVVIVTTLTFLAYKNWSKSKLPNVAASYTPSLN